MSTDHSPAEPADMSAPKGLLLGRKACIDALRSGLLTMADDDTSRHLLCCDPNFMDWPLDEPDLLHALAQWLRRPGRSMTLLAQDYSQIALQRPRFVQWRKLRTHCVQALQPSQPQQALPGLLLTPTHAVQLLDKLHWRGRVVDQIAELATLQQQSDALQQRSEPAWPASTLGL